MDIDQTDAILSIGVDRAYDITGITAHKTTVRELVDVLNNIPSTAKVSDMYVSSAPDSKGMKRFTMFFREKT